MTACNNEQEEIKKTVTCQRKRYFSLYIFLDDSFQRNDGIQQDTEFLFRFKKVSRTTTGKLTIENMIFLELGFGRY